MEMEVEVPDKSCESGSPYFWPRWCFWPILRHCTMGFQHLIVG